MNTDPLSSLASYSTFVAALLNRPTVRQSTLTVWPDSRYTGTAEGEVIFSNGCHLRMLEVLSFSHPNLPFIIREIEDLN